MMPTFDELLHFIGGAAIVVVVYLFFGPVAGFHAVLFTFAFGIGRELVQHNFLPVAGWNPHIWREALAWGVGGVVAWLLALLMRS